MSQDASTPDPSDPSSPSALGLLRHLGSFGRQRTQPSENPSIGIRKSTSFRRRAKEASKQAEEPKLKRDTCSAYGLLWEPLSKFLVERFPGYTFQEMTVGVIARLTLW